MKPRRPVAAQPANKKASAKKAKSDAPIQVPAGNQTLQRGLDLLEAVADGPLALSDLAERLGLSRSTTHRLAAGLVARRYLAFMPREGYTLGAKLLELGYNAQQQMAIPRIARPYLERLSAQTEDAVHLGVMDGHRALYLDKLPGQRRVVIGSKVGDRHSIASTGLGKALILDESEEKWLEFISLLPATPRKIDIKAWMSRMREYAKKGYAFDLEENEDRIRCVAAPIRGADGSIVAAISVSSAAQYMNDKRMASLVSDVQGTASIISRELGWTG